MSARRAGPASGAPSIPLLFAMIFASQLALTVFLPAVPDIARDLGTTLARTQSIIPAYLGAFAVSQLFMGPLSDTFGRRPVILGGLALFSLAGFACALAPDIWTLIAARILQAAGACATLVVGRAVIRDTTEGPAAARAMSYLAIAMGVGPAVAPFFGGLLVTWFDWRATFLAAGAMSAIILVFTVRQLPESLPRELRQPPSMTTLARNYLYIARIPAFLGYSLTIAFASAAIQAFLTAAPIVMITLMGVPPALFGVYVMIVPVAYMIASFIAGRLAGRVAIDRVILAGCLFSAAGGLMQLALGLAGTGSPVAVLVAFCISNFGTGLILANCYAQALNTVPRTIAGAASALSGFLHVGWAFCLTLVVANVTHTSSLQFGIAQAGTTTLSVVAVLVLLLVVKRRCPAPG